MICGSGHTASVWNAKIGVPRQAPKNLRPSDKLTPNPRSGSGSFDFINHTRIPRWGGPSSADECWRLSGECGRWAAESGDNATRGAVGELVGIDGGVMRDTTKPDSWQPAAEMTVGLFDNWFDPIESEVRARAREFIEEMIRGELDTIRRDVRSRSDPGTSESTEAAQQKVRGNQRRSCR